MFSAQFSITSWARFFGLSLLLWLAACAQQGRPPGGPPDETSPSLVSVSPESLAVSVAVDAPLVFEFSEKVDRRGFRSTLQIAPERRLRGISFKGERVVVRTEEGWPVDTLVVWTLLPSLKDKHGVKLGVPLSGAFTTGDSIPGGWIRGQAVGKDLKLEEVMAELRTLPAEGKRSGELWRMAGANQLGFFRLGPLEVPSGPYDLKVYFDKNGNGKRDEHEAVAERDSLRLSAGSPALVLGELSLIDLEAPVAFVLCFPSERADCVKARTTGLEKASNGAKPDTTEVVNAAATVEADTTEVVNAAATVEADSTAAQSAAKADIAAVKVTLRPIGVEDARLKVAEVDSTGCLRTKLAPGDYKVGAWVDLDEDGRFGPTADGMSEPFTAERDLTLSPAVAESLQWAWPSDLSLWAELDTMRAAPLPREIFRPETNEREGSEPKREGSEPR